MTSTIMAEGDEELVALIDNELDERSKSRLLARLAEDVELRKRYDALREAGAPIGPAFDALLQKAPLARLRQAIPSNLPRQARGPFARIAFRELAAGVLIGFLAAAAAWFAFGFSRGDNDDDWRSAVVDYMKLYTSDTFAFPSPDPGAQAAELAAVGQKVGVGLTPENVALPGLTYKIALTLSYDGAPLGEIAYVDPESAPVLLCVVANGGADAPVRSEKREEFSLASWSRGGRGYLVIARMPEPRVAELARKLEARL
jgi:anti-sigma factor RsiW